MSGKYILTALLVVGASLASAEGYWRHPGYMPPPPPPPYMRAPFGMPYGYRAMPMMPRHNIQPGRYSGSGAEMATVQSPAKGTADAAAAGSSPSVVLPSNGDVTVRPSGTAYVLADSRGMTLYTYSQDQDGRSSCSGPCAKSWPPIIASSDARADGDFSLVERVDGTVQWAYEGRPLYTWVADRNPGETKGDGVGSVWRAARL